MLGTRSPALSRARGALAVTAIRLWTRDREDKMERAREHERATTQPTAALLLEVVTSESN